MGFSLKNCIKLIYCYGKINQNLFFFMVKLIFIQLKRAHISWCIYNIYNLVKAYKKFQPQNLLAIIKLETGPWLDSCLPSVKVANTGFALKTCGDAGLQ